ncbi:hypothetical protein [Clostridium cuniculi]|uniref:hypothetical protein n=1 Tax=Clostridium cuniculi TaxID=2548455 RepID=UPI0010557C55|nr:hypothetical protein [Clostridium cuniculi]
MNSGYNKIFWGFIFLIFHIKLGSIKLLPDFISYMVIYFGIKELIDQYKLESLKQSANYASILIFIAFIKLLITFSISSEMINNIYFNIIWMNVFNIVEIIMIYKLLVGSSEILKIKNNDLYDNYNNKISIYLIIASIITVGNTINMIFYSAVIGVCIVFLALALRLWIIILVRRMYNLLKEV